MRQLAKGLLPPLVAGAVSTWLGRRAAGAYLRNGQIPWSRGYDQHKRKFITDALTDRALAAIFREGRALPSGYGAGLDERCVEYPWVLAKMPGGVKTVLDAGSALNEDYLVGQDALAGKAIHIMTLAPESRCFYRQGVSYVFSDLREIPIRDAYYDAIACISTLEHVGCDNSFYAGEAVDNESRPSDFLLVMRELNRVLKPGGSLLLTVPFGLYRHWGAFQQFDQELLSRAIEAFGPAKLDQAFYRYRAEGWELSDAQGCARSEYVQWVAQGLLANNVPRTPPVEPDRAAAARALACVHLVKG